MIICEKDTIFLEPSTSNYGNGIGKIHSRETTDLIKKQQRDSNAKPEESFRIATLDMQHVTKFKKTIFSKSIDLNFDNKKDLITIFILPTDKDTTYYMSFYIHFEGAMKNTFDYILDQKIDGIKDIKTSRDSTIVITAFVPNQSNLITKKLKHINNYKFISLN